MAFPPPSPSLQTASISHDFLSVNWRRLPSSWFITLMRDTRRRKRELRWRPRWSPMTIRARTIKHARAEKSLVVAERVKESCLVTLPFTSPESPFPGFKPLAQRSDQPPTDQIGDWSRGEVAESTRGGDPGDPTPLHNPRTPIPRIQTVNPLIRATAT